MHKITPEIRKNRQKKDFFQYNGSFAEMVEKYLIICFTTEKKNIRILGFQSDIKH